MASKVAVVVLVTASVLIVLSITVMISGFIAEGVLTSDPQREGYGAISWADLLALFGRMVYGFVPYIMLALFLVVLTSSNGVGIGLSMGYYITESIILTPIIAIFDWSGQVYAFLLGTNVAAWQSVQGNGNGAGSNIVTIGGMPEIAHGAIFVTIYAVALAAAALALFLRRDIAGARGE